MISHYVSCPSIKPFCQTWSVIKTISLKYYEQTKNELNLDKMTVAFKYSDNKSTFSSINIRSSASIMYIYMQWIV